MLSKLEKFNKKLPTYLNNLDKNKVVNNTLKEWNKMIGMPME
jgi:hypothetical protein